MSGNESDTVTLYHRWDGYDYVTPVTHYHQRAEFRTVRWCVTHNSPVYAKWESGHCQISTFPQNDHNSPQLETFCHLYRSLVWYETENCQFVDKLVEA